jgi:two-component system nitrogen regulation sensor histidine kinase GlnL
MNTMSCPETRILDSLATGVLVFDAHQRVIYINQMGENLLGVSSRHLLGQHLEPYIRCEGEEISNLVQLAREGQVIGKRGASLARADREVITIDCVLTHVGDDPADVIVELTQVDRQLRINRETQLISQQAATKDLLRGLAHEIKNPLGGLRGAAQLLAAELSDPELDEYTRIIIAEADRLKALVDNMLGPNRRPEYGPVNVHHVLERVRQLILAEYGPDQVALVRDYDPSIPELVGDMDQLIQAILNIVRNAVNALAGRPDAQIRLKTRIARNFTIGDARHRLVARVEIIDNGPGIPEGLRETLFLPMVTSGQGQGLGLAIAQQLITHHRGLIECRSEPGNTVFTILLPLSPT